MKGLGRVGRMIAVAPLVLVAVALAQAPSKDDAALIKDFEQRVSKYESLRNANAGRRTASSSAKVVAQQKGEAAQKVQEAWAAKQGDIFTPGITSYFKAQIKATLDGPQGKKIRASLRHAEPLPDLHLAPNQKYPQNLPLQSTPPTLLLNLPKLPKELQYRVVGSTFLIYDESTALIVDLIPGAMP